MSSLVPTSVQSDFESDIGRAFVAVVLFRATPSKGWETVRRIPLAIFEQARTADQARDMLEAQILDFLKRSREETDWLLSIPAVGATGFSINLRKAGKKFTILIGELGEDFSTLPDALEWVGRALSDAYQLRVSIISGRHREWALEPVQRNERSRILKMGNFVPFRSWRSIEYRIYRNNFSENADAAN